MSAELEDDKTIIFLRHGVSEMNEYLGRQPYGSPGFKDPGLWDTRLTSRGEGQARDVNQDMKRMVAEAKNQVELIVSSPLTRALQTATLAFDGIDHIPRIVSPLISERMWLTSDVGRPPAELIADFASKGWSFEDLDDVWWYTEEGWEDKEWREPGKYLHAGEPLSLFRNRLALFKEWLKDRPEKCVVVVSHWGTIYSLTGRSANNCQTVELPLSAFYAKEILDPH